MAKAAVRSVVIDSLLIVTPILRFFVCSMIVFALLCFLSNFAIMLMGKRERDLVVLLCVFSLCLVTVIVLWIFLTVSWVRLQ